MRSFRTNGSNGGALDNACRHSPSYADSSAQNADGDQGLCDASGNSHRNTLAPHDSRCIDHGT